MSASPDRLCIFCRSVEVKHWVDGPRERSLACTNPKYLRGMASEAKACCLFEREPGADDELERELQWARAPLCPMPDGSPRLCTGVAPVRMPAPKPPRKLEPYSRAFMADYHPSQEG